MTAISLRRFYFSRLHYYLLLWKIYYAALKRFEINDSTAVDSIDDEDEVDYSSESSGSEADWWNNRLYKNTTGTKLKALAYAKF